MIFRSPRKILPQVPVLAIGTDIVDKVETFKYLGAYLDSTLSWDDHINKVASKISSMCGILRRISYFVPRKVMLHFYFAHIHSHLSYLIISWGRACKSKLKKLQILQNRCLKIIFKLPFLYPSIQLYANLPHTILPILGLCEEQTLLMVHSILHDPQRLHNLAMDIAPRIYNTRQINYLSRSHAHSNFSQKRISFIGPTKYNRLPMDLQSVTNALSFKTKVKQYLRDQMSQLII